MNSRAVSGPIIRRSTGETSKSSPCSSSSPARWILAIELRTSLAKPASSVEVVRRYAARACWISGSETTVRCPREDWVSSICRRTSNNTESRRVRAVRRRSSVGASGSSSLWRTKATWAASSTISPRNWSARRASMAERSRSSWAQRAPSRRPSRKGPCRRWTRTRRDSSTRAPPVADGASSAAKSSSASVRRSGLLTEAHLTGPVAAAPGERLDGAGPSSMRWFRWDAPSGIVYLVDSRMRAVLCDTAGAAGPRGKEQNMSLDLPTIIAIAVAVLIVVVLLVVLGVVLGRRRRARQHEEDRHRAAQLREEAQREHQSVQERDLRATETELEADRARLDAQYKTTEAEQEQVAAERRQAEANEQRAAVDQERDAVDERLAEADRIDPEAGRREDSARPGGPAHRTGQEDGAHGAQPATPATPGAAPRSRGSEHGGPDAASPRHGRRAARPGHQGPRQTDADGLPQEDT